MAAAAFLHHLEDTHLSGCAAKTGKGLDQNRSHADAIGRGEDKVSLLSLRRDQNFLALDEAECRAAGSELAEQYQQASPFPHVIIDDVLDRTILREVERAFPARTGKTYFDRDQERLKYQFNPAELDSALVRSLFAELNNAAFLAFLSAMTGIKGLIPDPYFHGGGLHETCAGGHLSVHADFNIHEEMKVERRLNVLIYLNEDWDPAFGGDLELWDRDMAARQRKIAPLMGRAVIFNTALDSFHGHPDPLTCPPERTRRSIATYYYTAVSPSDDAAPLRTTNFRPRPNTGERRDWKIAYQHWVNDWVPARLQRYARRLGPR
jgi:Rps23 Pro-64 3,4-dihydroxylase Tpa1-like proline 4-hydroxylase